jgi:hypothetical protein
LVCCDRININTNYYNNNYNPHIQQQLQLTHVQLQHHINYFNNNAKPVHCYTGTLIGVIYVYSGTAFTDYDDLVIATLRSRGLSTYGLDDGPVYEVSGLTDVSLDCTGTYSGVTKNPFSTFGVNITSKDGDQYFFETSLSNSDPKYLSKVFGSSNFSKPRTVVPLFVEERFQALLTNAMENGLY